MRRSGASLFVLIALFVASSAEAHLGHVILRAERYLKLDASESDTRLVVSLTLGPDEGARVLGAADANGDHDVSQAEADAYLAQWGEGLRTDVPIEIDGEAFDATWTEGYLEPIGPVTAVALTVEITAHLPLANREHVIRYRDHMRREVFDRTDVAFRAHDGAELVMAGAGEQPSTIENDLSFTAAGADAPDVLTAHVRFPARTDASPAAVAVPVAVVVVALLGVVVWRRRKR